MKSPSLCPPWVSCPAVLCTYLDGDLKKVRTSIAVGGAVPLAMFLIWDAVALGLPQGAGMADPLEALMR